MAERGFWTIPCLWPGATVHILGGGPSLLRVNLERLRSARVIATNHAYKTGQWDVMTFGDLNFYRLQKEGLADFAGLKIATHRSLIDRPGIHVVKRKTNPFGVFTDPSLLAWNRSTGGMAINIAVLLGAKRIVLHGYDMRRVPIDEIGEGISLEGSKSQQVGERTNWHEHAASSPDKNPYARFLVPFSDIARDLKTLGVECVNATQGSAIKEFPIVPLEDVYPC